MKIFGREPAEWLALVAVLVELAVAWGIDLTETHQGYINAVATAVMGLAIAATVAREKIAAAVAGFVVAALQLAVSLGVEVSQEKIAMTGVAITVALAFWLRNQVTAPITDDGARVPTVSPLGSPQ